MLAEAPAYFPIQHMELHALNTYSLEEYLIHSLIWIWCLRWTDRTLTFESSATTKTLGKHNSAIIPFISIGLRWGLKKVNFPRFNSALAFRSLSMNTNKRLMMLTIMRRLFQAFSKVQANIIISSQRKEGLGIALMISRSKVAPLGKQQAKMSA